MAMTSTLARRLNEDFPFRNFRNLSIGFDGFLENVLSAREPEGYPPYNIIQTSDNHYRIEVALAGFKKSDIKLTHERGYLCIAKQENAAINVECDHKRFDQSADGKAAGVCPVEYIHRGISARNFVLKFRLAEQVKVDSAKMEDGILTICLRNIVADSKAQQIAID